MRICIGFIHGFYHGPQPMPPPHKLMCWVIRSHFATIAGVMNFVRMSVSVRAFLSIR